MPKIEEPAPTPPERKIVQIAVTKAVIIALCDDGSVWYKNGVGDETWYRVTLPTGFAGS